MTLFQMTLASLKYPEDILPATNTSVTAQQCISAEILFRTAPGIVSTVWGNPVRQILLWTRKYIVIHDTDLINYGPCIHRCVYKDYHKLTPSVPVFRTTEMMPVFFLERKSFVYRTFQQQIRHVYA